MKTIRLPSRMNNDLSWKEPREEACKAAENGEEIFWEFDLGLASPYFSLEDELLFNSLCLSLSTFSQELWPLFEKNTKGASLYHGSIDFSLFFIWSEKQEANWLTWKKEQPLGKEKHLRRLFCADAYSFYFQMLSHRLPDELPITLTFDTKDCGSLSEVLQLISQERFEHFKREINGITLSKDSSLAVCFPEEAVCSEEVLTELDLLFDQLEKPIRVIQEPFLTEQWEGVEYLCVLPHSVTQRGIRKLMGFCASGGTVIVKGELIGLPQEVTLEEIRGRGIRTPGLLVPNQSR